MSLNLTLSGVPLLQTPTDLTVRLVVNPKNPPSQEQILAEYLKFVRECYGLAYLEDDGTVYQVREWFLKNPDKCPDDFWTDHVDFLGYKLTSLLTGKFFHMLRDYFDHELSCNVALNKGATFSYT